MEPRVETSKIDQIRIAIGNMREAKDPSAIEAYHYVARCMALDVPTQQSFFDPNVSFQSNAIFDHGRPSEGVRLYLEKLLSAAASSISIDPSVSLPEQAAPSGSWGRAMAALKDRLVLDVHYHPYAQLYPIMFLMRMADEHSPELWKLLNKATVENGVTFVELSKSVDVMWVLEHVMLVNPKVFASFTYNLNWFYSSLMFPTLQNTSIHALHKIQADMKAIWRVENIEAVRVLRAAQNILAAFRMLDLFYSTLKSYEKI